MYQGCGLPWPPCVLHPVLSKASVGTSQGQHEGPDVHGTLSLLVGPEEAEAAAEMLQL